MMMEARQQGNRPSAAAPPGRDAPDAHGQAALLLAESTLHLLVEAGRLTREQAVEAVCTASSVNRERAEAAGESRTPMLESIGLLNRIELSLDSIGAG